ncbi:D-glycero-beta-D-manno-heptose-7-phosphate kinase [bacterium]|nr:D-glycero-beta-D-manno-heptose-7-phosphate kinase [bacterium]
MDIDIKRFDKFAEEASRRRIAVLGDIMIDHYIIGNVSRISPEAPVPILESLTDEYRLGGAANVALNISTLDAKTYLIGVVGKDNNSSILMNLLHEKNIDSSLIVIDDQRPTTIKSRITSKKQQIVRVDREVTTPISKHIEDEIISNFSKIVQDIDALIIEDYNKGLLTERVITSVIDIAKANNIIISVDPKVENFFNYKGVTVFKPNLAELSKNMNKKITNEKDLQSIAWQLFKQIKAQYLVVTLGEKGMLIFEHDRNIFSLPTYAREVFDVSGAGDTVISTLTLALTLTNSILESAIIANHAAGVVCGKQGTSPTNWEEIRESVEEESE